MITMAPKGVLQIVIRPRQVRRFVALEQAWPVALCHFQEVPQALLDRGLIGRGRCLPHPHQQLHQPTPDLRGRQLLPVLEDPGHALDPLVGLPHRREQGGCLLQPTPQQLLQTLQTRGQTPRQSRHLVQAGGDPAQSVLQLQPRSGQRRQAVVGQGGTHRGAVAPYNVRLLVLRIRLRLAFDPTDSPDSLLQFLLGMTIGLGDRLGRLAKIVEVTELVRHALQRLPDGVANALLAVGDHTSDRHGQRLAHLGNQAGQVLGGGRQEAPGPKDLPGEAVTQDPEDLVTDVGLQSIDGQDDATLLAQQGSQPLGVGCGQRPEFVVAVQEVGDRALRNDQAAAGQPLVDLGDAAVLGISEPSDSGHDIEAELVIGQGEVGFGLGPVGQTEPGAIGIVAASDGQRQMQDAVERGDGAEVVVAGPERLLTFRAIARDGDQAEGAIGFGARSSSLAHGGPPFVATPFLRSRSQLSLPA